MKPDPLQLAPDRLHVQPWGDGVAVDLYEGDQWSRLYLSKDQAERLLDHTANYLYGGPKIIGRGIWDGT